MVYPLIVIIFSSTLNGVVEPFQILSMGQINLFKNYLYSVAPSAKKVKEEEKNHS